MVCNLMGVGELSRSIGARLISNSCDCSFTSVAIDSRKAEPGSLFFALKGSACDGHSFVKDVFEKGAKAAVVDASKLESFNLLDIAKNAGKDLIVVENTLKGLQDSARVYLEKFPRLKKIGITGSSGKTTTKEITAAIISCERKTVMNKGNLNSETGLPLSVFEVRQDHEVGVFELGMNRTGEIEEIANVLKPNIACITNIGTAHIEYFGSKDKILNEKKNIFKFLQNGDIAIIPSQDEYSSDLVKDVKANIRFYGAESFTELENTRNLGLQGTEITWAGEKIRFSLPGKHSLHDAMAAIAIAKEIPVSNSSIKKGLEQVKPLFGRLEILNGKITIIRDCYNANPESTSQSIEFCDSVDCAKRKIYVVGDMLELGDMSEKAHARMGEELAQSKADMVFLFGSEVAPAAGVLAKAGKDFYITDDIEKLKTEVKKYIQDGDIVLLKGSRGCALERLTCVLEGENV